jgi:hypothetical protein
MQKIDETRVVKSFVAKNKMNGVTTNAIVDFITDEWNEYWFETMKTFITTFNKYEMYHLFNNPNVTPKLIANHPNEMWNNEGLCKNSNFTKQMLIDKGIFNPTCFSINKNLTMDDVLENRHANWNWWFVSRHPNITETDIENNLDLPWNWKMVAENRNVTTEFFWKHLSKFNIIYKKTNIFCRNITMDFIDSNPPISHHSTENLTKCNTYDWRTVCEQTYFTVDYVKQHCEYPWNWSALTMNKSFTMTDIENNPEIPWEIQCLAHNKNLTFDMVKKHLQEMVKCWLCKNPFIVEKRNFIKHRIAFLLVITMHEFYQQPTIYTTPFTNVEYVFFEAYFVQRICKY